MLINKDYLIFIDTNCLNEQQDDNDLNELEKLERLALISIEKADVMDTEMIEGGYAEGLKKSAHYIENYGPAVWNHSRWDHSVFGDDSDTLNYVNVLYCLFGKRKKEDYRKQQIRDAMHIVTAIKYGATYFVTKDKGILKKAKQIKEQYGLVISNPKVCLDAIKQES